LSERAEEKMFYCTTKGQLTKALLSPRFFVDIHQDKQQWKKK
jgi:hypothetical protein